jgi:hypothetical protein
MVLSTHYSSMPVCNVEVHSTCMFEKEIGKASVRACVDGVASREPLERRRTMLNDWKKRGEMHTEPAGPVALVGPAYLCLR